MGNVATISVSLVAQTLGFSKGIKNATTHLLTLRAVSTQVKSGIGSLAGALAGVAGAAGIGAAVKGSMDLIDSTSEMAAQLGLSANSLVGLRGAAELAGSSQESLDKGLMFMNRNLGLANAGLTSAGRGFMALGLSAQQLQAMAPEQAFFRIAGAISQLGTASEKTAAAQMIFDTQGTNLINLLNQGAAGAQKLSNEVLGLGAGFSAIDASKIDYADNAMKRVGIATRGVFNALAIELAPWITVAATKFQELLRSGGGAAKIIHNGLTQVADVLNVVGSVTQGVLSLWHGGRAVFAGFASGILEILSLLGKAQTAVVSFVTGGKVHPETPWFEKMADEFRTSMFEQSQKAGHYFQAAFDPGKIAAFKEASLDFAKAVESAGYSSVAATSKITDDMMSKATSLGSIQSRAARDIGQGLQISLGRTAFGIGGGTSTARVESPKMEARLDSIIRLLQQQNDGDMFAVAG